MKIRTLLVRPFGESNPERSGPSQSSQPLDHRHCSHRKLCLDYIHPPLEYEPASCGKCRGSVARKCCGSVRKNPPARAAFSHRARASLLHHLCITIASPVHHLGITLEFNWNSIGIQSEYNWNSIGIQLELNGKNEP